MAYVKNTWASGDKISSTKMNHLEQGVADAQEKLVSGTNIKTVNNQSLLGSGNITIQGGSGEPEIFWAEYGIATYADIVAAASAGKNVLCHVEDDTGHYFYQAAAFVDNQVFFTAVSDAAANLVSVTSANVWSYGSTPIGGVSSLNGQTGALTLKTVGGNSIIGTGDIPISGGGSGGAVNSVNGKTGTVVLNASDVGALPNTTTIPTQLSQLTADSSHRTVTDTEKNTWNAKGTYSKPSSGIPKADLASDVQTSLGKADSALQSSALSAYRTASAQDVIDAGKQPKLTAGTNITIDPVTNTISASGRGGGAELFIATYNVTTFAQVQAAWQAGKIIRVKMTYADAPTEDFLCEAGTDYFRFTKYVDDLGSGMDIGMHEIMVTSDNTWRQGGVALAQRALVSGTNIKTINNQSLLGSGNITIPGGSGEPEVFWAEYGITTYADIMEAISAGMNVLCYNRDNTGAYVYQSVGSTSDTIYFVLIVQNGIVYASVTSANVWNQTYTALQEALTSGTNIKTINNQSLLGSGNITIPGGAGEPEVFWAVYGVTTYADIIEAISAGMNVLCYNRDNTGAYVYQSVGSTSDTIYFVLIVQNGIVYASVTSANVWNQTYTALQEALTSGTNIKTVGGQSLLGAGDIPTQAIFPVNVTETTQMHFTANKTFAECLAAFNAGQRPVFVVYSDTIGVILADVTSYVNGFLLSSVLVQTGLSEPTHVIFSIAYSTNGLSVVQYAITAASE